jgi:Flp pilus assembly pilin Flp
MDLDEAGSNLIERCSPKSEGSGAFYRPDPSTRSMRMTLQDFYRDERGLETIEYVVLATLVAALMTLAIIALFNTIVAKIKEINSSL